jgi:excisionase family DNA binding protein
MNDEYYTLQEVADLLKVKYLTIFRWVRSGKLPAYKFGKQYRVSKQILQKFINESMVTVDSREESA